MSLLQIAEPNKSNAPHQHKYAIGIDLGTTRSLVAVVQSATAKIIPAQNSEDTLLPSVVYYGNQNSSPIVGSQALSFASTDPKNTIISAKRFMGRSEADVKFSHPYQLDGSNEYMPEFVTEHGNKSPVEISAEILSTLKQRAINFLPDESLQGAVITVPAYFDEAQRQATKDAATIANINILRLLNEPTAAAMAYGLDKADIEDNGSKTYLIYDLGGGTFDVSILKLTDGIFEVLATGGNSALGGDDIDRLIANWLLKQAGLDPKQVSKQQKSLLSHKAKQYKQLLSTQSTVDVHIDFADNWHGSLTEEQVSQIIEPVSKRSLSICEQVLRDAKLTIADLDEVILVGGSTRMPTIQKTVKTFFNKQPLCSIDPDQVVALGAAQAANQLINNDTKILLLDVTPLSLGLETMGGLTEVLIPRNTPIPVSKRQVFTTYQDGQTGMVVHVVQGERETIAENRSLGQFILNGIPPMKAGLARIEVTFTINADGQLTVQALETTTGSNSTIEIVPSYGLSPEQTEKLLNAGFEHAEQDKQARSLIEMQVESKREVLAIQSAIAEFGELLSSTKKQALLDAIENLENSCDSNDIENIKHQQNALKPLSDEFAALIMNQAVQKTMSGTSANDWQ